MRETILTHVGSSYRDLRPCGAQPVSGLAKCSVDATSLARGDDRPMYATDIYTQLVAVEWDRLEAYQLAWWALETFPELRHPESVIVSGR
jgi:hypothetical protein